MAERYISELTLRNGGRLAVAGGDDTGGATRIVIGSGPWALVLDPQDALALSVLIDRAYRAMQVPR
ncbi:MAG: hypothetical protein BGP24_14825 [Lysobacterales bacterium 69-70]|nr:hypothetical protein [Xanthomonadaceae bacterium]ODU35359.1 MAG: hypothetical protein ABS97_05655 [Xanthomonadaceae bacterium SCN 69-320]ODV17178.1 MAG: hypothetical protein ABT27_17585 [Xanthomonadaceae bacterium SCN 69-25]OJY94255.1 MAG: hypothetical protein BGP24_14825 [Xanthomonadales bacterium 69-70]